MKVLRYIDISPWHIWRYLLKSPRKELIGIFRNRPGIVPGRWGFYILGLEIGSRNPKDPVGVWLWRHGLWRW